MSFGKADTDTNTDEDTELYNKTECEILIFKEMAAARNFKEYPVWNDAIKLSSDIYIITDGFPLDERRGLCSQMQRAAVSIASNIAEGAARSSKSEFKRFLEISLGSSYELESQLIIAKNIHYLDDNNADKLIMFVQHIEKQLSGFINSLKEDKNDTKSK